MVMIVMMIRVGVSRESPLDVVWEEWGKHGFGRFEHGSNNHAHYQDNKCDNRFLHGFINLRIV